MNKGIDIYRALCPQMFTDNTIYSINSEIVPPIIPRNVTISTPHIKQHIINHLSSNKPLTMARYNDGEWIAMLKIPCRNLYNIHKVKWNDSGQKFVDDNIFPIIKSKPSYPIGISSEVLKKDYVMQYVCPYLMGLNLFDGGLFARWSLENSFSDLFPYLNKRNIIIVAPNYYSNMQKYFKFKHVHTPINNVWDHYKDILDNLDNVIKDSVAPVILYSCSFVAKKLIDINFYKYPMITQLDIGAAFDAYCGENIRPWHKFVKKWK